MSVSTPPGDEAAWFWSTDCVSECDRFIWSTDLSAVAGFGAEGGGTPFEMGVGLRGISYPYLHGYVQLDTGVRPWGVGARLGVPIGSWHEHSVFGRYDVPLRDDTRLLLNPSVFLHTGSSPNDANEGSFVGFVQGVGVEFRHGAVSLIPALSGIYAHTSRTLGVSGPAPNTIEGSSLFVVGSLGVRIHPGRTMRGR